MRPPGLARPAAELAPGLLAVAGFLLVIFAVAFFDSVIPVVPSESLVIIGGVAAVILELAEPAVRTGVWEFSSFRKDPVRRLKRTGLAGMITVYGAKSKAEEMIAHVVRMHARVTGSTPSGA